MSLIKLLQEASSLPLSSLKKAMMKDPKVSAIFKKDLSLDSIEDKDAFLTTLKYYLFNNESVKSFVASRAGLNRISKFEFDSLRKLKVADLTDDILQDIKDFAADAFKEHAATNRGSISTELKKELQKWTSHNGRYFNLMPSSQRELMSIPSLRPSKKVVLYRGVLFSDDSLKSSKKYDGTLSVGNGLKFLKSIKNKGKEVDLAWDRPSSWTTSKEVAERFAKYGPATSSFMAQLQWFDREIAKKEIDGALGYVISTLADPEDILIDISKLELDTVHGDEREMILKPGTYHSRIIKKYTVHGEVDISAGTDTDEASQKLNSHIDAVALFGNDIALEHLFDIEANIKTRVSSSDCSALLKYPTEFKKLILNSTTTEVIHTFDKLSQFYKETLHGINQDDVNVEKFALDDAMSRRAQKLKEIFNAFNDKRSHSAFTTPKGGKSVGEIYKLSGDEFRQTFKQFDIPTLEKDLLTGGKIGSGSSRFFTYFANAIGSEVPPSTMASMGLAKQQQYLDDFASKFFNMIGLSKPDSLTEQYKTIFNLIKKAYRNYAMIEFLQTIQNKMQNIADHTK